MVKEESDMQRENQGPESIETQRAEPHPPSFREAVAQRERSGLESTHQTHLGVLLEGAAQCRHLGYQKSLFSMSLLLECGRGLGQHLPGEKEN